MITNTLTSLAIMKVNIDQGTDYINYLLPFVSQVIFDDTSDEISSDDVKNNIYRTFGLEIPNRTVEIVLRRMAKKGSITRNHGVFIRTNKLFNPNIPSKKATVERHIQAVLHGLQKFSEDTQVSIDNDDQAATSICSFLAEFDIACLRAHLRGTVIPNLGQTRRPRDIVLVSNYIQHIQRTHPERFDSFITMVQGHMLANALTCPDLKDAPKTYQGVEFYLDTPLLIHSIGAEGKPKQTSIKELVKLLQSLGAKVFAFHHSIKELQNVLITSANQLDSANLKPFNQIVQEARRTHTTKSDLIYLSESIHEKLGDTGIEIVSTPAYDGRYQIDEQVLGEIMEKNYSYRNPNAKLHDINSVRSIYALRGRRHIPSIEKSVATFVTSNSAFAKAARKYGNQNENSQDVSSVVTEFSLANMAWLKAPMEASSLPKVQLLAFAHAAVEPTQGLWESYMEQIEKLESSREFSEHHHQLLRSSPQVVPELMHLTLGEESALTKESVIQILQRVSDEIKKEAYDELATEQRDHQETRQELQDKIEDSHKQEQLRADLLYSIYTKKEKRARACFGVISAVIVSVIATGLIAGLLIGLLPELPTWLSIAISSPPTLFTLYSLRYGKTVEEICERGYRRYLKYLLQREEKIHDLEAGELSNLIPTIVAEGSTLDDN